MNSAVSYFVIVGMLSYLCGAIPWAFIIGRLNGIDIRKHGSGNVGATNVMRVLGKKWGVSCFVLDFIKGVLPVFATKLAFADAPCAGGEHLPIVAGLAAVVGHVFPVFLGFRGGKGVATSAGVFFALSPLCLLAAAMLWAFFFYSFRYVSLASIVAALALPLLAFLFDKVAVEKTPPALFGLFMALALLTIVRHRENIKRLIAGTENKFEKKKT